MFSSSFFSKVLLEFSQLIKFFLDFDEQENVTWTLWSPRRESKPKNISKKKFVAHLLSAPHEFLGQQLMVNFAFALNNPEIFRCRTSKQSVLCDLKVQFRCLELRILFVWRIPLEKSRQKQEGFLPGYKKVSNETEMIGIFFSRKNMTSFWDDFLQHDLSPGSAHDVQLSWYRYPETGNLIIISNFTRIFAPRIFCKKSLWEYVKCIR